MKPEMEDRLIALGIGPVGDTPTPLSGEELAAIEAALGGRLPDDYRDFAEHHGAVTFALPTRVRLANPTPLFVTAEGGRRCEAAPLSHFYGAHAGPQGIAKKLRLYKGRMPDTLIPVADDGGGNQICLGVAGAERGKVFYWDHELEWDEDDYEAEHGTPMPLDVKFQNVYLVANSFEEFISGLEPLPE